MMDKKKWRSPQAVIISAIVILIFAYIGIDLALTKPKMKTDIEEIRQEYVELSDFLDKKVPAIEDELQKQAEDIATQRMDMATLFEKMNQLGKEPTTVNLPIPPESPPTE